MMPLRVLVIDDSVVMRRMVREVLSTDPEIEVVGVAANGRIGLAMIEQLTPDAVTLDIEMPEMNGLEMLRVLRLTNRNLRVIMFSTLTCQGALGTLDALALGADDYVTKPSNVGSVEAGTEQIKKQLIPKLKVLCGASKAVSAPSVSPLQLASASRISVAAPPGAEFVIPPKKNSAMWNSFPRLPERVDVVAIGTSTGGPNALGNVIPCLPVDLPVPVLIVQHMPPTFTKFLSDRLNAISRIPVVEAVAGDVLEPGKAWIAPGDYHVTLKHEHPHTLIETNQQPKENSCRPSVDVLFRSVAEVYGSHVLAVVMTGMGQDGLRGCEHVREARGQILVQDEASSVVWGMPGFVAKAGLADEVLPLAEIGPAILRRIAAR
ncbi:MAG: chemotaxis response regulator protein-glutamate methylesterase [Acidobacteria bacterium]|nr:MAG: chemotaxis response regulator protein-glutamate methylesterase [Acidobacteriota bacterium]